ncbi:MAG: HAD family hydrolase [Candidatus Pacebacteria bacterium]|nr:HAD family hydrolase [Candidatus Paceibacterota bacterium]
MKQIFIFDFDGVLFDTSTVTEEAIFEMYPGITPEMQREVLCGNFHEEIEKLKHLKKAETDEEKAERKLRYAEKKSHALMYPGAQEFLKKFHSEGCVLVLNTSAFDRNCVPLLERAGVKDLFDFLATKEVSKSKVEKFKVIQEKYNANTEDILFITDTLGDLRESDIAGVPTIAVLWGAHDRSYFTREEHPNLIGIVASFDELTELVESR